MLSQRTLTGWLRVTCLLLIFCRLSTSEKVLGVETDEFDFDGLPGAQHEFKIEIGAGREECFYQPIVKGGKLHVSFEVLRGGDGTSALFLLNQDPVTGIFTILQKTEQVARGGFQYGPFEETRAYAICLDNTASRMASKLVYVYLVTYVEEEWSKYRQEIEDLQLTVTNFSETIKNVQQSITDSLVHQASSRMNVIRDWYLITGNNTYVQRMSIAMCLVIVISSCVQVYFVRRLFRYTNVTSTKKPRA
ncbi:transmembrane emp24 domain-containing protein 6-like isoform X1 [Dreissena polymorpha]|uniref:transmembrane emp24 domain-containing protein 6-like isoform X1 n=1 Tax=Dreissena polymorpha TaxID=45954 RepID=UPI0022641BE9|nr:transmembrane emp24 domain-containing protein 6-like isoform X1 [Dreissena polymorpha]